MVGQVKILFVDDEINVLKSLKRLFLDENYDIITASSGQEGIEILKKIKPIHLVISDYRMPEMNGVDFLKEVCTLFPETIRIVLSGYADTASMVSAINDGQVYKFIPKPWNDDELKITVVNAIEKYFLKDHNKKLTASLERQNEELTHLNENLERVVKERTKELLFQNEVLNRSQNILDALPVGVMGIDMEGQIVQANKLCMDIFEKKSVVILGGDRYEALSEEMNLLINSIIEQGNAIKLMSLQEKPFRVKGVIMKHHDGQEGIILTFDEECRHNSI